MKDQAGPRRWVKLFSRQFVPDVEQGRKLQTVRPIPKRNWPAAGEIIECRYWEDKPYRSKQVWAAEGVLTKVCGCCISETGALVSDGSVHAMLSREEFARMDGFPSWDAMRQWFERTHGLPFEGMLLQWRLRTPEEIEADYPKLKRAKP